MRRRISLLLAAMLAGTTLTLFGPTQPASAVFVCGGSGTATVNPGLLYPVLFGVGATSGGKDHLIDILLFNQQNIVHGFNFSFTAVPCVHPGAPNPLPRLAAAGILKGYCGHSSGTGTLGGQQFSYVSAGTFLLLTGAVVGVASAVPVPVLTGSCLHAEGPPTVTGSNPFALPSGATQFLVQGAGIGLNCTPTTQENELVIVAEPTLVLPTQELGLHVGPYITHIWVTAPCAPNPVL